MSSVESPLHPNEKVKVGPTVGKVKAGAGAVGVVLLIAAVIWGAVHGDEMRRFFHSYLISFAYYLSFALGALFFVVLHHLVGARWSVTVRRTAEVLTQTFPVLLVLSGVILVPMLMGNDSLYLWSMTEVMETDHLLHQKAGYLNVPFFVARIGLYFVVWLAISRYFFKKSVEQDVSGDPAISTQLRKWSAPAMILFAFTCAFAGFDLLMTIEPHWFSTMFGVYYFAGCAISIMALLALISMLLQRSGRITHSVTTEHYHDLGKLLFAFVFFWAYVAFSQFMLIWSANIPEETGYFFKRWFIPEGFDVPIYKQWRTVTIALILFHWAFPFVILMSRHTKRKLQALAAFCVWMLVWHWVDIYWQVMPAYNLPGDLPVGGGSATASAYEAVFHPIDIMIFLGIGCMFVAAAAHAFSKVNLIPVKDPHLAESLRFENQ